MSDNQNPVYVDDSTIVGDGTSEHPLATAPGVGVPGGTNTAVQFNDNGAFGGESTGTFPGVAGFSYDKTTGTLLLIGKANALTFIAFLWDLITNPANNGLEISQAQVALIAKRAGATLTVESDGDLSLKSDNGNAIVDAGAGRAAAIRNPDNGITINPFPGGVEVVCQAGLLDLGASGGSPATDITIGNDAAGIKTKIHMPSLQVFANNAAAIAGGLTAGVLYRDGADPDNICIVH